MSARSHGLFSFGEPPPIQESFQVGLSGQFDDNGRAKRVAFFLRKDYSKSTEYTQYELERLRAENEALKKGKESGTISMKVSEKGAVSVYGLGRFPVTLYQEQ